MLITTGHKTGTPIQQPTINSHLSQTAPVKVQPVSVENQLSNDPIPTELRTQTESQLVCRKIISGNRKQRNELNVNKLPKDDTRTLNTGSSDIALASAMAVKPRTKSKSVPTSPTQPEQLTWSELQEKLYPPLKGTIAEEKKIFVQSLDYATRGLKGDEKTKAVLLHIMKRVRATGYSITRDNEGTIKEVWAGVPDLNHQSTSKKIDFWIRTAIESQYLPEGSQSYFLYDTPTKKTLQLANRVCVYQSPDGDHYVLDATLDVSKGERLLTFKEYSALAHHYNKFEFRGQHRWYFDKRYDENTPLWLRPLNQFDRDALAYQSKTPLDKSIFDADLKAKVYARFNLDPDTKGPLTPVAAETGRFEAPRAESRSSGNSAEVLQTEKTQDAGSDESPPSYRALLLRYADKNFYSGQFITIFEKPVELLACVGAAIGEATMATAYAFYKRHKIIRRRRTITAAHTIKKRQDTDPTYYRVAAMNLPRFKDFLRLSFLIDPGDMNQESAPLLTLAQCHKRYQSANSLSAVLSALKATFPNDDKLIRFTPVIDNYYISEPKNIATLQKVLAPYGISIEYKKIGKPVELFVDKFRKKQNEKLHACMHKTIINKKLLYKKLHDTNRLPNPDIIADSIEKNEHVINTLNKLKNYDDWKLTFITSDSRIKIGAAVTGVIPLFPVYELTRVGAYYKEGWYREENKKNLNKRITNSLEALKEVKGCISQEYYKLLSTTLHHAKETKNRHIEIKENKVKIMKGIHLTSAAAEPFSDIAGPVGSGIRGAIKGLAKVSNSLYPMVQRYRADEDQKEQHRFITTKQVYANYKTLYLHAKKVKDVLLKQVMTMLAEELFDLSPEEFDMLTDTSLVEDERFKLSLCRPVGDHARITLHDVDSH